MKRILIYLALLLTLAPSVVSAQSANGSFAFTLSGYTVQGQLSNPVIQTDNRVSMTMTLADYLQTSIGSIPISGSGEWYGTVNGTTVSGTIQNVSGTVQACYLIFFCGEANYVGEGTWAGTVSGSQGSGIFQGTITFTSSSIPQIHLNQPTPISGNWNVNF